jgi:uncharacterized protein YbjT (DUF2867 family)
LVPFVRRVASEIAIFTPWAMMVRHRRGQGAMAMKVIIFGASGMIGQGVLRECLLADDVESVLSVVRVPGATGSAKLREVAVSDFTDLSTVEGDLAGSAGSAGADACFFCLGVSSAGMNEADYTRITYDFTAAAARTLARLNPDITFVYISGAGTDSTERGRTMWARVKGRTENTVLELLPNGYAFRPGIIQPLHGARSRTRAYRIFYRFTGWLFPVARRLFPNSVLTTEQIGRAMLRAARQGLPKRIMEARDIAAAA